MTIVVVLTVDAARARTCLGAVAAGVGTRPCEVVLVLNGADEAIRALVARDVTGARVIEAAEDLGTPAAWRHAIAAARGRWVALLHEDAVPRPGWLEPLIATLEAQPRAGAAGSRLLWPDGSHQNEGWVIWDDGHASRLSGELVQPDGAPPRPVDYVSSASLLADASLLRELDLPDERWFPAVYTDSDISYSMWAAGRLVLHEPRSVVVHATGAMVQRDGPPGRGPLLPVFLNERNRARFCEKWPEPLATASRRPEGVFPNAVAAAELREALAVTARRAAAITARPAPARAEPAGVPDAPDRITIGEPELSAARARRAEFDRAYVGWLEEQLQRAQEDLRIVQAAREREAREAQDYIRSLEAALGREPSGS